jgi:hypothetical protein
MHGTIEITKPRKWTARDEYYLRAALERAVDYRNILEASSKPGAWGISEIGRSELRQCLARADESVARLLEQRRQALEVA